MAVRSRRSTAAATAVALAAGTVLLLTGCEPADAGGSPTKPSGPASGAPTAAPTGRSAGASPTKPSGPASSPAAGSPSGPAAGSASGSLSAAPPRNGTAHNGLTISNGTRLVVMNGTTVDFGTVVRDLAWSPDGRKAAFVDGSGDLVVANPDGSGRVVVAKNPGGQTWSHPTWQVTAADQQYHFAPKNNLFFAATVGGVARLEKISATAVNGTPEQLGLFGFADGENTPGLPQTGNVWPSTGGEHGSSVYANSSTGEVYIRDDYLRQQGGPLAKGSEPALSPNGEEVVFVRSVGGHDHLFRTRQGGKPATDLTPKAATDYTEPAWSPDGRTIAARTPDGIVTLPADGSAAPTLVSDYQGLPAYRHQ